MEKLPRGLKRLLITLLAIAVGILLIVICLNNEKISTSFANVREMKDLFGNPNCSHSYVDAGYQSNGNGSHTRKLVCTLCGETSTAETTACTYENGECKYCGYILPQHTHSYSSYEYNSNEDGTHEVKGVCSCGSTYVMENAETCTYENGECKYCKATEPHTHSYSSYEYYNNGDGTHDVKGVCSSCGYTYVMESAEICTYENDRCKYCNAINPQHTHAYVPYEYTYNGNDEHGVIGKCSICNSSYVMGVEACTYENGKCKYCEHEEEHTHVYSQYEYNSNEDGTHEVKGLCSCGSTQVMENAETCTYENYICKYCNAIEPHTHLYSSYEYKSNEDGSTHEVKGVCACGYKEVMDSKEGCWTGEEAQVCMYCNGHIHIWKNYKCYSNDDGTHKVWAECSCGVNGIQNTNEQCFYENGVCVNCGFEEPHTHSYSQYEYNANDNGTHEVKGVCSCGTTYVMEAAEECTYEEKYIDNGNQTHDLVQICKFCNDTTIIKDDEGCTYENGECKYCEHEQSGGTTGCSHTYEQKNDDAEHWKICSKCGIEESGSRASHQYGEYKDNGDGKHSRTCSVCTYEETAEEHNYGEYEGKNDTNHTRKCEKCNSEETVNHNYENGECTECEYVHINHQEGNHENDGICAICKYKYQEHGQSTIVAKYEKTKENHTPIYACKYTGCEETYTGDAEAHNDGNHENDGTCQTEDCGYKYQEHGQSTTIARYEYTEEQHIPLYECIYENCSSTYRGTPENHTVTTWKDNTNGTHSGDCETCSHTLTREHEYENGVCKDCNASETITDPEIESCEHIYELKKNDTQHWEECTKCNQIKKGTLAVHIYEYVDNEDGTHSATCTVCKYETMKEHEYENGVCKDCEAKEPTQETECEHTYELKKNNTQHWKECSKCGQVEEGTLENHIYENYTDNENGTHSATCTVCEYVNMSEHTYRDGECKDCGAKEENNEPECEHTYELKKNATQHWNECSKCNTIEKNSLENHIYENYTDNGDGTHKAICSICEYANDLEHRYTDGECRDCEAKEPTQEPECEHTYIMDKDGIQHWKKCSKCGEIEEGTLENHTYGNYVDNENGTHSATCTVCEYVNMSEHTYENGECKDCNAKEPTQDTECEHTYELKKNATQHWNECSKCGEIEEGTVENHTYGPYTDNGNGTHSATCTVCKHKNMSEHTYQDGECKDCNAKEPIQDTECEHTYVIKKNSTQHWQECSKCKEVQNGSLQDHTYGNCVDNENGTHTETCTVCKYQKMSEHTYQDGECKDCNAKEPTQDTECEHTYVINKNSEQHWKECSKCGDVEEGSLKNHVFTNYIDNKNGTHTATCTCGYKLTEEHNFSNDSCTDCGAIDEKKECEHVYIVKSDENNHWAECKLCGKVKNGTLEAHKFTKYVDNKNGTHSATCSECGYTRIEKHEEDGSCKECSGNINNNNGNTDNTITDKEIPKAGAQGIILATIAGIAVVMTIAKIKMKKYKDI